MIQLITGGARSGKSRFAQQLAEQSDLPLCYLATAQAFDDELQQRIAMHRQDRADSDADWALVEEPIQLAQAIDNLLTQPKAIVVDCLTLWLNNCMRAGSFETESRAFLQLLQSGIVSKQQCNLYIVSNEVGSGIVPLGELSRQFVDNSGHISQGIAQLAEKVTLMVAGLPLTLK